MEMKKTIPFIKKHLTKLQLKLDIQREAMIKKNSVLIYNMTARVCMRMFKVNRKFRIRLVL